MMRLMSHRWHSASDALVFACSGRSAHVARDQARAASRQPGQSPVGEQSRIHDAIMMCRAIVRGLSARVASKRGAAADRRACAVRGRSVTVWAAFRQPFCHIVYEAIMRQSGCNHDWGRDDQLRRRTVARVRGARAYSVTVWAAIRQPFCHIVQGRRVSLDGTS